MRYLAPVRELSCDENGRGIGDIDPRIGEKR